LAIPGEIARGLKSEILQKDLNNLKNYIESLPEG
jgi:hypothetical protein